MFVLAKIIVTALEAVGEICSKKKPRTPEEVERQRILRRNERALAFFAIFCLILSVIVLCLMIFK